MRKNILITIKFCDEKNNENPQLKKIWNSHSHVSVTEISACSCNTFLQNVISQNLVVVKIGLEGDSEL